MTKIFDLIALSDSDLSSGNEAYIECTAQQINLHTSLEALFKEIDLTADILYLSYNTLRHSNYSIKVFDCHLSFYESVNKLSSNLIMLSEAFSHIQSITGESYNRFEDIKQDLMYIDKNWIPIRFNELNAMIAPDLDALKAEDEIQQVQMVLDLLTLTFKSLSIQLVNFNDTVENLIADYKSIKSADTNMKDNSNPDLNSFAFKFHIYTRCIDTILRKYLLTSKFSSQRISEFIGQKHLTISQASEQLNQLIADLKQKWSDRFR